MIRRAVLVLSCAGAIVVAALVWDVYLLRELDSGLRRSLTQPIRLQIRHPGTYREFILGLRVHHYRAQPRGEADFVDIYYDTAEWDLFSHGFSYRFRRRVGADNTSTYSVRLEQEPRFVPADVKKIDVTSRLPTPLGDAIANGAWSRAILEGNGLAAPDRLRTLLAELAVQPRYLEPRLVGELQRERFDITDKGQSWFELDHELWTFRPFEEPSSLSSVQYEDIVLDVRLKEGSPELVRRVRTMYQFANMIDGVRFSERVPHERAAKRLGVSDRR